MDGFDRIAWFPLCAGLTAVGLILSWTAWRRRGLVAGLRGVAWSLLPVVGYLTGLLEWAWRVGDATVRWATRLVFSPSVWLGVILAGVTATLFVVTGFLRRRGIGTDGEGGAEEGQPAPVGAGAPKQVGRGRSTGDEDGGEFADVEEILRRRGIT